MKVSGAGFAVLFVMVLLLFSFSSVLVSAGHEYCGGVVPSGVVWCDNGGWGDVVVEWSNFANSGFGGVCPDWTLKRSKNGGTSYELIYSSNPYVQHSMENPDMYWYVESYTGGTYKYLVQRGGTVWYSDSIQCPDRFVNRCDSSGGTSGSFASSCASSYYNCADLTSDTSVGRENAQSGWCSDGIDNDCDGRVDEADGNCPVSVCGGGDEGRKCQGSAGDLAGNVQSDGMYCDTGPSPNRCCPTGEEWNAGILRCEPAGATQCNPDPCNEEPGTAAWWSDNNCITASEGCCYQGVVDGQESYTYESHQAY